MLYALTHVIMTESGYFQERPDLERVAFTIPHLFRGLQRALDDEDPARSLDLIAEIVGCLTFVGVAAEERIDAARQRILMPSREMAAGARARRDREANPSEPQRRDRHDRMADRLRPDPTSASDCGLTARAGRASQRGSMP